MVKSSMYTASAGHPAHRDAPRLGSRFYLRARRTDWWAHVVGARRVRPHKHCATHPPKKEWRTIWTSERSGTVEKGSR